MKVKEKKASYHLLQRPVGGTDDYEKAHQATLLPNSAVDAELVRGDREKGRRFKKASSVVVRKPHISSLLSEGYGIAQAELRRLTEKVEAETLDPSEVQKFYKLMDVVIKAAKEEREQLKDERAEDMDIEDLLERAEEAKRILTS